MPERVGPILIGMINKSSLYQNLSKKIVPYKIALGYIVRMIMKSNQHLLLALTTVEHQCRLNATNNFCYQCSAIGRNFMEMLSDNFIKDIDLLMYIHNLREEEKRKDTFLTTTAHSLSLPVQSILVDSANLLDEINTKDKAYTEARHLFHEVQNLLLVTQSMLHGAEQEIKQPKPELYKRSLLIPLREACEMFSGEARDKGCDIRPIIEVNNREIPINVEELDDFEFYKYAFYVPLFEKNGFSLSKKIYKRDINTILVLDEKKINVDPENLPERCFKITKGLKHYYNEKFYAFIRFSNLEVKVPLEVISQIYIPKVRMVPTELSLAFKNILNNAVKYSFRTEKYGEKRYVKVICRLIDKEKYEVEVSNYGIGIEDYEIERGLIWKPRWRGKLARDRNRMGSGFGLSLVKRVIEKLHNGNIKAQSFLLPGRVYLTIFTVTLPVS